MFEKYNKIPLLLLVIIAAVLSIGSYALGMTFLVEPISMGDLQFGKSVAELAKDALFAPLRPLMYALIILSIGSSLAISHGGLKAKFFKVLSLFVLFSIIGAGVAIVSYSLFSQFSVFSEPTLVVSGQITEIKKIPFLLKIYGVLTSELMFSIYAGVIFGSAIKKLGWGEMADGLSDLFMGGFRKFLQVSIPLAVFGSVVLALNSPGGVSTLSKLMPLVFVYVGSILVVWAVVIATTCIVLKQNLAFVWRAIWPQAVVSFSTSSSIATLPATKAACEQLGVNGDESTPFYTIGATVNMVGTLMGLTLVSLYAMHSFGIDITNTDKFIVALQAMIYSVSAAGVPSASVVLLQDILVSQGVSAEYASYVTGLIITLDTLILDRVRTSLNTQSDSMSTAMGLHLYYKKPKVLS